MKRLWLLPIVILFTLGSMPYRPEVYESPRARCRDVVDPYSVAAAMSGASVESLKRIAWAESSGGRNLHHSNPIDCGWYGLHERADYHAERAKLYGEYSASDPIESGRVAGRILMGHYAYFGDMQLAYTAYHRGRAWTIRNGVDLEYLARIGGWNEQARSR